MSEGNKHRWRYYDGMRHKKCAKCGECRPQDWPDDGCVAVMITTTLQQSLEWLDVREQFADDRHAAIARSIRAQLLAGQKCAEAVMLAKQRERNSSGVYVHVGIHATADTLVQSCPLCVYEQAIAAAAEAGLASK